LIQLSWLVGNFPYRFIQAIILDIVLITSFELKYWIEGDFYYS